MLTVEVPLVAIKIYVIYQKLNDRRYSRLELTTNGYFELLLKICLIDKEPRFDIFKRLVLGESEELKEKVQSSRRIHKRTIINTGSGLETISTCTYQIYLLISNTLISNRMLIYLLYN